MKTQHFANIWKATLGGGPPSNYAPDMDKDLFAGIKKQYDKWRNVIFVHSSIV